jgi:uncharacterized membrane protein
MPFLLLLAAVPFVLPIVSFLMVQRLRGRVDQLESTADEQRITIEELKRRVREMRDAARAPAAEAHPPHVVTPPPVESPAVAVAPPAPAPAPPSIPVPAPSSVPASTPLPTPEPVLESLTPPQEPPAPVVAAPPPTPDVKAPEQGSDAPEHPPESARPPAMPHRPPVAAAAHARDRVVMEPAIAAAKPFDWESVVGVKLFSAVAGIALVLAAVFFLRYSMDHGWLAPPVRVAIGIVVAIALLLVCERKAARDYPATANALDAAAIAILFSTFFAAHALWHLIPAPAAFGLLALVTALAVLLSIRRDSMFIAVLGLLGGFATPALLSTGQNQPIPLFAYLLLLNVGLAWVASRKKWPALTILTLVLTAIYQWGWVLKFLSTSQLSLAMGIFLLFAVVSFVSLTFGRTGDSETDTALAQAGLSSSAMPLIFTAFLAAVPSYGEHAGLLFGFLLLVDGGLLAVAIGRPGSQRRAGTLVDGERLHALGAGATLLTVAIWFARSYASPAWIIAVAFVAAFVVLYSLAPLIAARVGRPFTGAGKRAEYAAPLLLFVFAVLARIEPAVASPLILFGTLFALLGLIAWRALTTGEPQLYFLAAFFGIAAEASWSATFLSAEHLRAAMLLYAAFGVFYLGVPLAARRRGRTLEPRWGGGALTLVSLALLLFLATGETAPLAVWGLALLLAILNAGLFVESASGGLPWLSAIGALLSWMVLGVWWANAAAVVGLLPSLLVLVGLTLVMYTGHAWAYTRARRTGALSHTPETGGFQHGIYLGLVGHLFLLFIAQDAEWSIPPWPLLGSLAVMTLAASVSSMAIEAGELHASGVIAAAVVVLAWTMMSLTSAWTTTALVAIEVLAAYALAWYLGAQWARRKQTAVAVGATGALFAAEISLIALSTSPGSPGVAVLTLAHVVNTSLILAIAWEQEWALVAPAAVAPAWMAVAEWQTRHPEPAAWRSAMLFATSLYAVFTAYPFVLHRRARESREPYLTAVAGSVFFFFVARAAFVHGGLGAIVGIVPVVEAAILALLLRELLRIESSGSRDLGRLAFVAGAALAFVTVAIPLQLKHQWITIGWALEGAALSWLYRRIPHRKLLYSAVGLLAAAFGRLALNPAIFIYEPRGMRVFNWYLYTYLLCAAAMLLAGWLLSKTDDRLVEAVPPARSFLPAAGVILLFLVLNIEIADFYATGPEVTFRFGVTIAQDLTYTIGWLIFGLVLLAAGIYLHNRGGRIAAVVLITLTTCKAFLYDMGSLGGLYRVASLVGLAISLSLVALALQKFVLHAPKEAS